MTPADQIAASLAREFPVSARLLARGPAFRGAVDEALAAMTADELVRRVVEGGGLAGARNPYGVLIARIRQAVEDHQADAEHRAPVVALRPGDPRPASVGWVDVASRGAWS